jgi:internalin A
MKNTFIFLFALICIASCSEKNDPVNLNEYSDPYSGCDLIQDSLSKAQNIYDLNLSRSGLDTLCSSLFQFNNLVTLDLSWNRLKSLPNVFYSSFPRLNLLNMENNNLTDIPNDFCKLTNISYLVISNNYISKLPEDLGNFQYLISFK